MQVTAGKSEPTGGFRPPPLPACTSPRRHALSFPVPKPSSHPALARSGCTRTPSAPHLGQARGSQTSLRHCPGPSEVSRCAPRTKLSKEGMPWDARPSNDTRRFRDNRLLLCLEASRSRGAGSRASCLCSGEGKRQRLVLGTAK